MSSPPSSVVVDEEDVLAAMVAAAILAESSVSYVVTKDAPSLCCKSNFVVTTNPANPGGMICCNFFDSKDLAILLEGATAALLTELVAYDDGSIGAYKH